MVLGGWPKILFQGSFNCQLPAEMHHEADIDPRFMFIFWKGASLRGNACTNARDACRDHRIRIRQYMCWRGNTGARMQEKGVDRQRVVRK